MKVQERLIQKVLQLTLVESRRSIGIPGLTLVRYNQTTKPQNVIYRTSICMALQGKKRVIIGDDALIYDADHFLISSIDVPVMAQISTASQEKPYLGIVLDMNLKDISEIIVEMDHGAPSIEKRGAGMSVSPITPPLLDAVSRLIFLADEPDSIPVLAPLIYKEILFRMLNSEQGPWLRQIAAAGSRSLQITKAMDWIRKNFSKPLKIDALSAMVGMSNSSFHQHFKSLTAMSPLQYQKWLRLHEARNLLLTKTKDASSAAFEVGYDSPSQFSREYSRMFGMPPLKDIRRMEIGMQ